MPYDLTERILTMKRRRRLRVNIQVTDNWSPAETVPVTVTLKNVNELDLAKEGWTRTRRSVNRR